MTTLNIQAITDVNVCITTQITVNDNYTIDEITEAAKKRHYKAFRIIGSTETFIEIKKGTITR